MKSKEKILLVEDEQVIRNFLTAILNAHDYAVLHSPTGRGAVAMIASHVPDLVMLDLGLPDMDGMEVLRSVRAWSDIPVIVVSARQDEHEKVHALDSGANDYITKPFGNGELLARIRTALRQHARLKDNSAIASSVFSLNGLNVNYARRIVSIYDKQIHLTPIEYRILVLLSRNAGKVLTHDYIIREVWGPFSNGKQILRVNMANIRRKIEPDPADPVYILTEVGVGYRMSDSEASE